MRAAGLGVGRGPARRHCRSLLVLFDGVRAAIETVPKIVIKGRMIPASIELMDRISFQEACRSLKESLPYERAGAALLLESDGPHETLVAEESAMMESVCRARAPLEVFKAESDTESNRYWKIRKQVPWTLKALSTHCSMEDIVVPVGEIPAIIEKIKELEKEYAVRIPVFGHAGDGNLHATPLKNPQSSEADWYELIPRLLSDLYRATTALGGTISGEHGIGSKRRAVPPARHGRRPDRCPSKDQEGAGSERDPQPRQDIRRIMALAERWQPPHRCRAEIDKQIVDE